MQIRTSYAGIVFGIVAIVVLATIVWSIVRTALRASFQLIPSNIEFSSGAPLAYLVLSLSIGIITMTLVQIWRTLLPIRGYYQLVTLSRFLQKGERSIRSDEENSDTKHTAGSNFDIPPDQVSVDIAISELVGRLGGMATEEKVRSRNILSSSFFDLPIEQLCAQINLAFEAGLATPKRYPHLILCIVGKQGLESLEKIRQIPPPSQRTQGSESTQFLLDQTEARSALSQIGQQRVDAFQITSGSSWRRILRLAALIISILLSWSMIHALAQGQALFFDFSKNAGIAHKQQSPVSTPITRDFPQAERVSPYLPPENLITFLIQTLLLGLISAYIAMVLRDIVAILEMKRRLP